MKIKILLVDNHEIFREGIKSLIKKHKDLDVIYDTNNIHEIIKKVIELKPNIIILEITIQNLNNIEIIKKIKINSPNIKIIILTKIQNIKIIIDMFKIGIDGYILKKNTIKDLINAINYVNEDKIYLCPQIFKIIINLIIKNENLILTNEYPLSCRECEILKLIAEGKNTKTISSILNISSKTVETHRKHIMEKLNLYNIADLTKYAIMNGMVFIDIIE